MERVVKIKSMRTIIGALFVALFSISSAQSTEQSAKAARVRAARAQAFIDDWDLPGLESLARKSLVKALSAQASFEDIAYAYEVCAQYRWNDSWKDRHFWDKQIYSLEKKFRSFKLGSDSESKRIKLIVDMEGWSGWGSAAIYAEGKALVKMLPNDPSVRRSLAILDVGYGKGTEPILSSFKYFAHEIKQYSRCSANHVYYASNASILGKRIPSEKRKYYIIARDSYQKAMSLVPKASKGYALYERRAASFQSALNKLP